jgi:hypothetical protein
MASVILASAAIFYIHPPTSPIDYQILFLVDTIAPITVIWLFLTGFTLFVVGISIHDKNSNKINLQGDSK